MLKLNLVTAFFERVPLNFTCCPSGAVTVTGKMYLNAATIDLIAKK